MAPPSLLPHPESEAQVEDQQNKTLINEAIKRILLDIVIRGHGDRLIGRWSRDPDIQSFLERVPYMLDRVNQLHLVCMRPEPVVEQSNGELHHHHHHHHHHHNHHNHQAGSHNSSLHEFVGLIGVDQLDSNAWLVRTRDSLGLTPLHKTVLFHNRPICEFILDRYSGELAAASSSRTAHSQTTSVRLIDAQDKYGRTALHYAAGCVEQGAQQQQRGNSSTNCSNFNFYKFLLLKGASTTIRDFRGKTADYYVRQASQLRIRSIIHLANKLNANYQATVLSRTLRAMTFRDSNDLLATSSADNQNYDQVNCLLGERTGGGNQSDQLDRPDANRESMSLSCADLTRSCNEAHQTQTPSTTFKSLDNLNQKELYDNFGQLPATRNETTGGGEPNHLSDESISSRNNAIETTSSLCSSPLIRDQTISESALVKRLIRERSARMISDERTKLRIRRHLIEGKVDQINELLVEGHGGQLLNEAPVTCWNQSCRQYVLKVVPNLLKQVDVLHELIAANQFEALQKMLEQAHPILVRMRRPYKRAAMNSLHLAVQQNRRSIVAFLLERYPELVNQVDSNGATCLHWAARSLHNDRLYCWLTEHFGAQLESARDGRGKTAVDYRQQMIRLASFDDHDRERGQAVGAPASLIQQRQQQYDRANFRSIMRKQHESEQELEVNGTGERLAKRLNRCGQKHRHNNRGPSSKRLEPAAESAPANAVNQLDEPVQVRIGVESPSTIDSASSCNGSDKSDCQKSGTSALDSKEMAEADLIQGEKCRSETTEQNCALSGATNEADPLEMDNQIDIELEERSRLLSDELVQLGTNEIELDSSSAKNRLANQLGASGPIRASGPDQSEAARDGDGTDKAPLVDETIRRCIVTNNLKKLEHLILAGCGSRFEGVYKELLAASGGKESVHATLVSGQTRDFIERHALGLMQTIERIHETLHKCYSHVMSPNLAPADSLESNGAPISSANNANADSKNGHKQQARPVAAAPTRPLVEMMNSNFHKLCSLLTSNWFILARDQFGACPIHVALVRSDRRLLDYLLRRYPNAASAPDHEARNTLHYAAIVLATFERHGQMRLTVASTQLSEEREANNKVEARDKDLDLSPNRARAYWQVDSTSRLLYENLCARYGHELAGQRDKYGKTHEDYLQDNSSKQPASEHAQLNDLPDGLYPADVLEDCCKEYASMLKRYNYLIWVTSSRTELVNNQNPIDIDQNKPKSEGGYCDKTDKRDGLSEASQESQTEPKSSINEFRSQPKEGAGCYEVPLNQQVPIASSSSQMGVELSASTSIVPEIVPLSPQPGTISTSPQKGRRHHGHGSKGHRTGSGLARHSIVGGVIVPTIIHNDKMDEIETYDIIYRQPPAPSSRCSSSSSSCSSSSSTSSLSSSSISLNNELKHTNRRHHHQPTIDDAHLSKQLTKTLTQRSSPSHESNNHRHHHYRHRRNNHHHHHRGSNFGLANGANLLQAGLIGQVVPPPEGPIGPHDAGAAATISKTVAVAIGAESLNSSSSSSSDEDDERVERLSNEFENRVRREKNELRAKVDQIMKEIKLSARSSKSSRFLSSPNDLTNLAENNNAKIELSNMNSAASGGENVGRHKSSIASGSSSKATTTTTTNSDSSCSSPLTACSSSQCSNSAAGSVPSGRGRKSRTSSCSSASFSATSNSSAASSPVAAKLIVSGEQQQQPRRAQQTSSQQLQSQTNKNSRQVAVAPVIQPLRQQHLSELTGQLVSKNTYGQTYLHFIASRSQSSSTFYKVLEHGNHLVAERDVFYRTARDVALQFNLLNNVQLLDKFIIDLFVQGRMQLLWMLLKQGYSPLIHVSDPDGNDIMLILKLLKRDSMICYLLQMADFQRWRDELHTFIRNNYISGAIELIKKHKDLVRAKSVYARTSLHLAVLFDRVEMVNELISKDSASVHVVDNMGRTPLHYAFGLNLKNGDAIRAKLIASGAQLDFRDVRQRTAKYYYIFKREIEEIRRVELELN